MAEQEPSKGEAFYYGPLIECDSNDPEFVRGIEIGHLMGKLDTSRDSVEQIMHRSNEEMLRRVANAFGREYMVETLDDNYMVAKLDSPTRPNVMDAMKHPPE